MTSPRDIIEYLKNNPSFFEENQDLLGDLENGAANGAVHFYERQIQVLREREARQQAKIDMIVDSAESNRRVESDLLDLAICRLGQVDHGVRPEERVSALVKHQFNVEQVRIMLAADNDGSPEPFEEVRQRVAHDSSVCDDRVSSRLLGSLFGDEGESIQSCAFIPVRCDDNNAGVLVLGSNSSDRFQPGIGVIFLDRLGLLVGAFLKGAG